MHDGGFLATVPGHSFSGGQPALPRAADVDAMASAWKADAATFWMQQSARLLWREAPTQAQAGDFTGTAHVTWFADGRLNPTESCLDRHAAARPDACALIWEGQDGRTIRLSWADLLQRVCRMANALREAGVAKGDRVALHLPAVVESVVAMLACARIGAVHMVLFGGFSAEGLADRLDDGTPVLVVTADEARRGAKIIPMKRTMDDALSRATGDSVRTVLVLAVTGADVPMTAGRDRALGPLLDGADTACAPAILAAEDPLFVLYTSGSTGKPKGLVHVAGGYMVWASLTHEVAFGCGSEDVFWCTADTSWITGHTYVVYGPLANGTTVLMYEGLPSWPTPGRWWDVIDRHGVTVFYTSPTAIRAMKAEGNDILEARGLDSLRVLGSVGEPIGEDAWTWFHDHVGKGRCPVVDTWWQTETGGIMIAPAAGAVAPRPGVATRPLPGVEAVLLDAAGVPVVGEGEGNLCLAASWPGQARTIWGSHDRFVATYFATYPGHYFTGDAARREADGYFRITGRVDDVVNVSGHRIGTAEIESAVMRGEGVVECAAIGVPHGLKGEGLVVFAVVQPGGAGEAALKALVADAIGRYAVPEAVYLVADLPKTRSGKIVRRLLRKIAAREIDALGDLSTLADPDAVGRIIAVVQGGG